MIEHQENKPVVVVTGCSGLIGSEVIDALQVDYDVAGLDVKPPDEGEAGWKFVECDLTHDESVANAIEEVRSEFGSRIASVIHLAAYYDFSGEPSPLYDELTVEGTRRLLETLQNVDVEQFIFSSSLLVMKPVKQGQWLKEESETQSEWEYPRSKLAAESVMREHRGKIPIVIARLAGVYTEDCKSLPIAQQLKRIYEKDMESHFFPGNQDHGQSFIHLSDVVQFFHKVVDQRDQLEPEEVFLVGEPDVVSYGELQNIFGQELHGSKWKTVRIPKMLAKAGAWVQGKVAGDEEEVFIKPWMVDMADAHYPVDIARARFRLEWEPAQRLRSLAPEMARRLKENPREWYRQNNLQFPEE